MKKQINKTTGIIISSTTLTLLISTQFSSAPALAIESLWNFKFMGDITGSGTIQLDLQDQDLNTNSFLVTDINFNLDFGVGGDLQSIALDNFLTLPLRFNPNNSSNELFSTLVGSVQPGWNLGIIAPDGLFPGGGLTMSGSSSIGLPPDPAGIGGTISFTPTGLPSNIQTGTWTESKTTTPESSSVVGLILTLGFGILNKLRQKI